MGLTEIVDKGVPDGCDYALVTTKEQLEELRAEMAVAPILGVDTETSGLEFQDTIVGLCISVREGHGRYIPIRHTVTDGVLAPNQLDPIYVMDTLRPILETVRCTGHNIKFDTKMFMKDGVLVNYIHCTLVMTTLLGYDRGKRGLKAMVNLLMNHEMGELISLFPKVGNKKPVIAVDKLDPMDMLLYGCEDGDYSLRLLYKLLPMLKENRRNEFIYSVEMPLIMAIAEMEMHGVPTSKQFLQEMSDESGELLKRLNTELQGEIREQLGVVEMEEVNLNSPKQLAELLFDKLELPCKTVTESGARSTAGAVLAELAKKYPIMERILTYRLLNKLHNTFLKKMISLVQDDQRIRGNFNQVGTETGRFSSSAPNLQNIPKDQIFNLWPTGDTAPAIEAFPDILRAKEGDDMLETEWEAYSDEAAKWGDYYLGEAADGKQYSVHHGRIYEAWRSQTRQFVTAPEGCYLAEFDYSQVELRILAAESQEATFLDAFLAGDDVHKRTAAAIFGVPFENVTKLQRSTGKTINFGLLYGMGPQKLAESLKITLPEAKDTMARYFENLPRIKTWMANVKKDARVEYKAVTAFGRIRNLPEIRTSGATGAMCEREAANFHIQGAAADIMKIALVRLRHHLRVYFGDKVRMVCTVHDSVILECDNSTDPQQVVKVTKLAMEFDPKLYMTKARDIGPWPVLEVDACIGQDWAHTEDCNPSDDVALPEKVDPTSIPKFVTRLVAFEQAGMDPARPSLITIPTAPTPEPVVPEPEEPSLVVDTETGEVTEGPVEPEGEFVWLLEVTNPSTQEQLDKFTAYLQTKKNPEGSSSLVVLYPNSTGTIKVPIKGTLDLSRDDETALRLILGPCKLKQDIDNLNPEEIIKNLSFGTV